MIGLCVWVGCARFIGSWGYIVYDKPILSSLSVFFFEADDEQTLIMQEIGYTLFAISSKGILNLVP